MNFTESLEEKRSTKINLFLYNSVHDLVHNLSSPSKANTSPLKKFYEIKDTHGITSHSIIEQYIEDFKKHYGTFLQNIQQTQDPDTLHKFYTILDLVKHNLPFNQEQANLLMQYNLKNWETVSILPNVTIDRLRNHRIGFSLGRNAFMYSVFNSLFYEDIVKNTFNEIVKGNIFLGTILENTYNSEVNGNSFVESVDHNVFLGVVNKNRFMHKVTNNRFQEEAEQVRNNNDFSASTMDFEEFKTKNTFSI